MKNIRGVSLVELLFVLAIFGIVMAGLYAASSAQLREGVKEYRLAESEMEHGISKNIIERDISMAGYGIMDDYDFDGNGVQNFTPRAVAAINSGGSADAAPDTDPDMLTLTGTALGLASRAAQGWSSVHTVSPTADPSFLFFNDAREDVRTNDRVVMMDPNTKRLIGDGTDWAFIYSATTTTPTVEKLQRLSDNVEFTGSFVSMTIYGISSDGTISDIGQPYYCVNYHLGGTAPSLCAPGTQNLLRAESKTTCPVSGGNPILNCVLDFQVALGLDTDENGTIDLWDNAGGIAQGYSSKDLNKRLKQVRAYALVQVGNQDSNYTYSNPDPAYAAMRDKIRVGDLYLTGGAVGRDVHLTAAQRKYRWRVLPLIVTPRNTR